MLVTDTTWAETHPVRRALMKPFQAWRCVGWTQDTISFLVFASGGPAASENLVGGWLVGGPEALLEAAAQLEPGTFTVYALDRAAGDAGVCQVTGIWREREWAMPTYWYGTTAGEMRPCLRTWRDSEPLPELVCDLILDERAGALPANQ